MSGPDEPVLPERATDEQELGWGEDTEPDDEARLMDEVPPHHG